jgi:TonB family protein
MKKGTNILLFLCITFQMAIGQEVIEKNFYKNKYGGQPINEKDAKVVELTIKEEDGTLRYEMRSINNNKLLRLRNYKDGSPVGTWISIHGTELNYDFDLKYVESNADSLNCYNLNNAGINPFKNIELPKFPYEINDFRMYVQKQLVYPEICVENGIQGKIVYQFTIDERGKLTDLSVIKSVDKMLDKEGARAIHQAPDWIPAKKNGEPISICVKMQVVFLLQ